MQDDHYKQKIVLAIPSKDIAINKNIGPVWDERKNRPHKPEKRDSKNTKCKLKIWANI